MVTICYGSKVSDEFIERVAWIAHDLYIGYGTADGVNKLMACMGFESGRTFSAKIKNKAGSGATGLIQFMPHTAINLGTTVDALALMSAEDQLNYVYKYFKPYNGKLKTLADVYMAILWPLAVGKPETFVLWDKFQQPVTFRQNAGLDTDKNSVITKAEAAAKVTAVLADGMEFDNARVYDIKLQEEAIDMPDTKTANEQLNWPPVPVASTPYDGIEVTSNNTEPDKSVTATISHAVSGWQGNVAGVAAIAGALMLNPDFTAKFSAFMIGLSRGEGGWGALVALIGAGLIAYRSKTAPPTG